MVRKHITEQTFAVGNQTALILKNSGSLDNNSIPNLEKLSSEKSVVLFNLFLLNFILDFRILFFAVYEFVGKSSIIIFWYNIILIY